MRRGQPRLCCSRSPRPAKAPSRSRRPGCRRAYARERTGIISGTTPAAGSYPVAVTVSNGSGSATATYTIAASTSYALTPPMGWNSYDSFGASVKESRDRGRGPGGQDPLQPFGWNTVVIDYRWYDRGPGHRRERPLPAVTSKYPSRDREQRAEGARRQDPRARPRASASTSCAGSRASRSRQTRRSRTRRTRPGRRQQQRHLPVGRPHVGRPRRHRRRSGLVRLDLRAVRGLGASTSSRSTTC